MTKQELRELLQFSNDRLSIFSDRELLITCDIKAFELEGLVNEFLSDEQKAKLFEIEHFKTLTSYMKARIIQSIEDSELKIGLLRNSEVVAGFSSFQMENIIETLDEHGKIQILHYSHFIKQYDISQYQIEKMIKSLNDDNKKQLLLDKEFVEQQLGLDKHIISSIIASFDIEQEKIYLLEKYKLESHQKTTVLKTFSDETKMAILLDNRHDLGAYGFKELAASLNVDALVTFFRENESFMQENGIKPYMIVRLLDEKKQVDFVSKLEETGLSVGQKRQMLAVLNPKTKKAIDTSNFSPEYLTALQMKVGEDAKDMNAIGKIKVDFKSDMETYRDLDELLFVDSMKVSKKNKAKLLELCDICPCMRMSDNLLIGSSTAEEYKNAEVWIESVLQEINSEWSDIQKVAFVDNAIGKRVSYSPDFDTEVFDECGARALWKIIHSGYGVCNGIAQVEKYILDKIKIKSELVSSKSHTFLKLKEIELPTKNGETVIGDTILDPTWNLTAHRYGGLPGNFCKSYSEIRKKDIKLDGTDSECHKNDEELASATLNLDEQCLREIFASIKIADKEGVFPLKRLVDKSKEIDTLKISDEENIRRQLALIAQYCPEFAECQNSTMSILTNVFQNCENLQFNKCLVNRVYARGNQDKKPVLYVYIDLPEGGKKFYFANKESGRFEELTQKEFELKFECYDTDLEKQNGIRPWDDIQGQEYVEELNRSSGQVVTEKEEVR